MAPGATVRRAMRRKSILTLTLASTQLLGFLRIPPDWQVGANGAILVVVLAARVLRARYTVGKPAPTVGAE